MKILITGASGFVASYVVEALHNSSKDIEIIPTSRSAGKHPLIGEIESLDVSDREAVFRSLRLHQPTHVLHLAGIAAPSLASNMEMVWKTHVDGAFNIARGIMNIIPECTFIYVGSGLVYGDDTCANKPFTEESPLVPRGNYAVTKAAADVGLGMLAERGLKCIRLRPFNHTGARQSENFVVPAFAGQIARIEAGLIPPVLKVGDLSAERDFLDVRDVADAYVLLIERSEKINSAHIFNVASGISWQIKKIVDELASLSRVPFEVRSETMGKHIETHSCVIGCSDKLRKELGWMPRYNLKEMLTSVLENARRSISLG